MKKLWILFFCFALPFFCVATSSVDINSATLEELKTLTGIGEVKAQAIIDSRPYSSLEDLLKVKGIGDKTLQNIKTQGLACVNCKTIKIPTTDKNSIPNNITLNQTDFAEQTTDLSTQQEIILYPEGIFLNEILPSAIGSDETGEYIKIYNSNNFEVDMSGWKLKDTAGTITTFVIYSGVKISSNNVLVFKRPETKITLNNDGDGVILSSPDDKVKDSTEFSKSSKGWIWKKTSSGWQWLNNQTTNQLDLPKEEKSVNNTIVETNQEQNLSAVSGSNINPWFLFLIAVAITIISAIVVIFIKFRTRKSE